MIHHLKIEDRWLRRIQDHTKTVEIRINDRDYQAGDTISFNGGMYSDRRVITHVLHEVAGLTPGYVILSLADPRVDDLRDRAKRAAQENQRMARRISALKGQITRLKNRAADV